MMRRRFTLPLLALAWLAIGAAAGAQTTFDVEAYRKYVEANGSLTPEGLREQYPAGTFAKSSGAGSTVRYLDSIDRVYSLTSHEKSLLDRHGFMVTERQSYASFEEALRVVYHNDLPVFISTDAVLHAIHVSYDQILKDLETSMIASSLDTLLTRMHGRLPAISGKYKSKPEMQVMLRDLDLYLTVARRLLTTGTVKAVNPAVEGRVTQILAAVEARQMIMDTIFASTPRYIDYSQFTPRGHYTQSPALTRYFQAMIWLGRTEIALTAPKGVQPVPTSADLTRQAVLSALVAEAVAASGARPIFDRMESAIRGMVGQSDNVTLPQLDGLLAEAGITSADQLLNPASLAALRSVLETKPFAGQRINSQILMADGSPDKITPPSAFLLFGQRFTIDSYIMGSVVYDKITARRMLPSSLDVLFALGNNAAAQLLEPELKTYGYARNLAALRYLVDGYDAEFWQESIYNGWLGAVRTLNAPKERAGLPRFMQTAAWWQQKMNTQLASWAQLRHDNLLYVKQSYSGWPTCSFPHGLVEPIPAFYRAVSDFARTASRTFSTIDFGNSQDGQRVITYMATLGATADTLAGIADKQLARTELSGVEKDFLCRMLYDVSAGCFTAFDGWFARLFYRGYEDLKNEDMVVADVHTAPADADGSQVGWVMHVGTGPINLAVVTCEMASGETIAFVGPVMSYYEHLTTGFKRLTDEEWRTAYELAPSLRPDWTNLYLAGKDGGSKGPGLSLAMGTADVENQSLAAESSGIRLLPGTPNPSTGTTLLGFTIPGSSPVRQTELSIFDISGSPVITLLDQPLGGGNYTARWEGTTPAGAPAPDGVYFYRLTVGSTVLSGKMTLNRSSR